MLLYMGEERLVVSAPAVEDISSNYRGLLEGEQQRLLEKFTAGIVM